MQRLILFAFLLAPVYSAESLSWSAGTAAIKITPKQKVPLVGYASRTNVWQEVDADVYAKALALKDGNGSAGIIVTLDLCTLSPSVGEPICEEIGRRTGLKRSQILLNLSHTHSGPATAVSFASAAVSPGLTNDILEYTKEFQIKVVDVATEAFGKMEPVKIGWGAGVANFTMNRREFTTNGVILGVNPRGYVDRSVPVLRIESNAGEVRGVVFGYGCHGTTLNSDSLIVSPDYPGYAGDLIKKQYPKAETFFITGLGGSSNPYPRTGLELAKQHGKELGTEVGRVLKTKLRALTGELRCVMENVELPLQQLSREELEEAASARGKSWLRGAAKEMLVKLDRKEELVKSFSIPISVWKLGSELTLVGLPHEVVGEYVPLIEREVGPMNLWLAGYCNQVSGYIPTKATLREGGYECRGLYEGTGLFAPEAEDVLVRKVSELCQRAGRINAGN